MSRRRRKIFYDCEFIENGKTIDLVSIGMVDEDGSELYLVSSFFDESKANPWVRKHVLPLLPTPDEKGRLSRKQIKKEILNFVGDDIPEWWAWYGAYDHVALCQLFGDMSGLPGHWPHYTRDLRQIVDSLEIKILPKTGKSVHDALEDARWNKNLYSFLVEKKEQIYGMSFDKL